MKGDVVYNIILNYIRKDGRGDILSVEEFNRMSVLINKRVQNSLIDKFEENIDVSSECSFLKVLGHEVTITAGEGILPSNFNRLIGLPYHISGADTYFFDVVTSKEFSYRQADYLTRGSTRNPIMQIAGVDSGGCLKIVVRPTTINTVYVDYLRDVATPYLDYYIKESTFEKTYLDEGEQVEILSPYIYRDGTTGLKTSATVDWEWDESELPLIVYYFLQDLGIVIPENLLIEVGKLNVKESEI